MAPGLQASDATPVVPKANATNEVVVQKNIMIRVRDGINLAVDVYHPANDGVLLDGKFPTILARTPYNKDGTKADAEWFAARGYVAVMNDVRGRYESEGTWRMIVDDPNDGYDVVQWILNQ